MKLEDQVCSLELSKKLLNIGIEQNSLFCWCGENENINVMLNSLYDSECNPHYKICSAFTASELLELLPCFIDIKGAEPFNYFWLQLQKRASPNIKYVAKYLCDSIPGEESGNPLFQVPSHIKSHSSKLTDCLAELLIALKE